MKLKNYYKWSTELQSPSDDLAFCKENLITATEENKWPLWWNTGLISNPGVRDTLKRYEDKHGFDALWEAFISKPRILVTTVFKVKGGEADRVVVFTASSRKVEEGRLLDPDNEARIMYTSVTRAKKAVYFTDMKGNVSSDYLKSIL